MRPAVKLVLVFVFGVLFACGGGIPSELQALDLPFLEGAEITSSLDKSCGYKFIAKKSEAEVKKSFIDAVSKKGWKPSDKKQPEVMYMGMLFEKGDQYLAINPMSKSGGEWGVTVSMDAKSADIWH